MRVNQGSSNAMLVAISFLIATSVLIYLMTVVNGSSGSFFFMFHALEWLFITRYWIAEKMVC